MSELIDVAEQGSERAVDILLKAAAFAELHLDDPGQAVSLYREVLEHDADHQIANEGLEYLLKSRARIKG